jgi:hypothetical protein
MAATVAANARSIVHADSGGVTIAFPDVCKTPAALGAPLPYPNIARSADAGGTAKRTTADGKPICLKRSTFTRSTGDEPGSAGGVVSQTMRGPAHPVSASGDVIVEGHGVLRAFDLLLHNRRNTPPFPVLQPPILALPRSAAQRCLLCGKDIDAARPGRHVPDTTLDEAHRCARTADGGACLWDHRAGWEETSCSARWQARNAIAAGLGPHLGSLPPDALHERSSPCWHNVHHLIPPRLLHEAIAAATDDGATITCCQLALLHAGYNINHAANVVPLPLLPDDARRLALPRHLVIDAASVGIPAAIAGAWEGKNIYDLIVSYLITPPIAALVAACRPGGCTEPGPAPGPVAKAALEAISELIRGVVLAPNRMLAR